MALSELSSYEMSRTGQRFMFTPSWRRMSAVIMPCLAMSPPTFLRSPALRNCWADGGSLAMARVRVTLPPSWSIVMSGSMSQTSLRESVSARICSGDSTFLPNRTKPPGWIFLKREISSGVSFSALTPSSNNCPCMMYLLCAVYRKMQV